jgi:hypothetical protein
MAQIIGDRDHQEDTLATHDRGPSWLTFLGHTKDSL